MLIGFVKMKSFKEYLQEAPVADYSTMGNWDKAYGFRNKRDRMLVNNPATINYIKKKFENTDYEFNFLFLNSKHIL
jgi:hypothetical protein